MAVENVKLGGESPEEVAYKLLLDVSSIEGSFKDRKTLLDAYAECLRAVQAPVARVRTA